MIDIKNLTYTYANNTTALKDVSLTIHKGELITILGQNGSGKTTLVKHLNGLLKPTSGTVLIDGTDTAQTTIAKLSKKIAYVFQNPNHQIFSDTVFNEIAFTLKRRNIDSEIIDQKVNQVMVDLNITHIKDTHPMFINHAEKQMVAIASYLVVDPEVFIFDEPTSSLDYFDSELMSHLIDDLLNKGKTIIVISHDMNFAVKHPSRIIVMHESEMLFDGTARDLFNKEDVFIKTALEYPQIKALIKPFNKIPKDIFTTKELVSFLLKGDV